MIDWSQVQSVDEIARDRLAEAKLRAVALVNAEAGRVRSLYITVMPGQEMIYLLKEAEARNFLAQENPPVDLTDYPFLAAEVGVTAPTAYQLAQTWANIATMWRQIAAEIENGRLTKIRLIEAATSMTDLDAIGGLND